MSEVPLSLLGSSVIFEAYVNSDFFGKLIFIALFLLSASSWALLIYKLWLLNTVRTVSEAFREVTRKRRQNFFSLDKLAPSCPGEVENSFLEIYCTLQRMTLEILQKNKNFIQRKHGEFDEEMEVHLSPTDVESVEVQLQTVVGAQRKALEKNVFFLSTVVSLAPFLGLLGTVWGILVTFGDLQSHASGNANEMVLGGLSMALGTTVLGLVVAIPAIIAHSYLKQSIRDFETEMENFSTELLGIVEMLYRKVDVT
ncbi:MAG: biopolymer transport protein TolQ [Chlamydiales bacterium]|jgi:biopolymer transport protein TolQ